MKGHRRLLMQENKEEQKKEDEEVIVPFHYEAEIVKANANLRGHKFVQRGPWLHCTSCNVGHGTYIGTKLMLVGYEDGLPKLVARR